MSESLPRRTAFVVALLAALACAALAPSAVRASARERVVTAKGPVIWAKVLDGTMLIATDRRGGKPHRIQRVVDGRPTAARGLTGSGYLVDVEQAGRDRAGRVVFPFARGRRTDDDRVVDVRWYLYDAAADRATRLRGLPGGKDTPTHVAVWRGRTAYVLDGGRRAGVYVRDADGTRRVSRLTVSDFDDPLVLRGANLVMVAGAGDEAFDLYRLLDDGAVCEERLSPASGGADHDFSVWAVWLTGRRVSWWMERSGTAGNLLLGTELKGDCTSPEEPGAFAPVTRHPVAVEGADRYTAHGRKVRLRTAVVPSTDPPANDGPAGARDLGGTLPVDIGARIGFATRQAGEPAVTGPTVAGGTGTATRTVWFSYRPVAAGPVVLTARTNEVLEGTLTAGAVSVYDDAGTGTLTELPKRLEENATVVTFTADPAHRYLIGIGSDSAMATWPAFDLRLQAG